MPAELIVFLLAAAPVAELRGAIPLGLAAYELPVVRTVLLAIFGNLLPVFLIYAAGGWWLRFSARRQGPLERLTTLVCDRARGKLAREYEKYGLIALALFVAVPLPLTGAWTGTLAAFLFEIPLKKAVWAILSGIVIAAAIVTLATTGAVQAFRIFLS